MSHEVYFTKDEASIREDQAKAEAERARKAKQDKGWLGYVGWGWVWVFLLQVKDVYHAFWCIYIYILVSCFK